MLRRERRSLSCVTALRHQAALNSHLFILPLFFFLSQNLPHPYQANVSKALLQSNRMRTSIGQADGTEVFGEYAKQRT